MCVCTFHSIFNMNLLYTLFACELEVNAPFGADTQRGFLSCISAGRWFTDWLLHWQELLLQILFHKLLPWTFKRKKLSWSKIRKCKKMASLWGSAPQVRWAEAMGLSHGQYQDVGAVSLQGYLQRSPPHLIIWWHMALQTKATLRKREKRPKDFIKVKNACN